MAGLELENPSQFPFPVFAFGIDLNRYWSAELAVDYIETNLNALNTSLGSKTRLGEYATWNVLAQVRLRYPLLNDRLIPYLLAGAGVGIGEFNDRNRNLAGFPFRGSQDTSFIGSFAAGVEYMVAHNLALGIEIKQIEGFENDIFLNGQTRQLDVDHTVWSGGLRLFFDGVNALHKNGNFASAADTERRRGYILLRTGNT